MLISASPLTAAARNGIAAPESVLDLGSE